jgi:hypothetical protein
VYIAHPMMCCPCYFRAVSVLFPYCFRAVVVLFVGGTSLINSVSQKITWRVGVTLHSISLHNTAEHACVRM